MRENLGVFAFQGRDGARYWVCCIKSDERLLQRFRDFCARDPAPQPMEVREFEDVVLSDGPKRTCLYDRDGRRIDASALPRYDDDLNVELWRAAETDDDRPVRRTISTPVVYHSILFNHWGHFLLESLARAWAHIEHPALAGVPALFSWSIYSAEFGDPYRSVLDAADIMALGQTSPPRKMRLAKCYVPTPSLATVGYAHPAHLLAPQRVARQLFSGAARDSRPVYLSRAELKLRDRARPTLANEGELEQALAAAGARIVRMQELSLAEQIDVINAHDVFIGPWGSALHNTLFRLRGRPFATYVLIGRFLPINFMMLDAIVGNDAHYLVALAQSDDFETTRESLIDVAMTLDYLKESGVF